MADAKRGGLSRRRGVKTRAEQGEDFNGKRGWLPFQPNATRGGRTLAGLRCVWRGGTAPAKQKGEREEGAEGCSDGSPQGREDLPASCSRTRV